MDQRTVNLRTLSTQFLLWWAVCFAVITTVFIIPFRLTNGTVTPLSQDLLLAFECAVLASLMAIVHYYFLFDRYMPQKKYLIYVAASTGLVATFILIDFLLFRFQIGTYFFLRNTPENLIFVNCERVIVGYVPLALVYAFMRRARDRKQVAGSR